MRKTWMVLALAGVLAMVPGPAADAGGKGAVKTDLLLGEYLADDGPPAPPPWRSVVAEGNVDVGKVAFRATGKGTMKVSVSLKDGEPNETFQVFARPTVVWGSTLGDQGFTLTTNAQGKGSVNFTRPIPANAASPVEIAVIVRRQDGTPDRTGWTVYRTREEDVPLK